MTGPMAPPHAVPVVGIEDREVWLQARRRTLGASDAGVVLGESPWATPLSLWAEKTGRVEPEEPGRAAEWGLRLESVIADWYAEQNPELTVWDPAVMYAHADRPWQTCTPDRFAWDPDRGLGVVQIKNASQYKADDWRGDAPNLYLAQVTHEMVVTGARWGVLVVLIGGSDPRVVPVDWDAEFAEILTDTEAVFWWDHVEADVPPPADGSAVTRGVLDQLWSIEPDTTVELTADLAAAWADAGRTRARIKDLSATVDELENQVRAYLGPHTEGTWQGETVVTYRASTELDVDRLTAEHPDLVAPFRTKVAVSEFSAAHPALAKKYRRDSGRRLARPRRRK